MIDILDLAEQLGLDLERVGDTEYACLCPIHDDTSPSLFINPKKQQWVCHACNKGGGVVQLYAFVRGVSYEQAEEEIDTEGGFAAGIQRILDREAEDGEGPFLLAAILRNNQIDSDVVAEAVAATQADEPEVVLKALLEV